MPVRVRDRAPCQPAVAFGPELDRVRHHEEWLNVVGEQPFQVSTGRSVDLFLPVTMNPGAAGHRSSRFAWLAQRQAMRRGCL